MARIAATVLLTMTLVALGMAVAGATTGVATGPDGSPCGNYWSTRVVTRECDGSGLRARVHLTAGIAIGTGTLAATAFLLPRLLPSDEEQVRARRTRGRADRAQRAG